MCYCVTIISQCARPSPRPNFQGQSEADTRAPGELITPGTARNPGGYRREIRQRVRRPVGTCTCEFKDSLPAKDVNDINIWVYRGLFGWILQLH